MSRVALAAVVAVALVAASGGAVGAAPSPDGVLLRASIAADGTATWTVEHRFRLDDKNATAAFEELRSDIEEGTDYRDRFRARMRATVADAENATGREMRVENVSVTAETRELPQRYGVVVYRFTWVGFAAADDGRLRVDRVLGGLFLDDDTRFVVEYPANYTVASAVPSPDDRDDGRLSWQGPIDFGARGPQLSLERADGQATAGRNGGVTTADRSADGRRVGVTTGLAVAAIAAIAAVALVAGRRATTRDEASSTAATELLDSEERVLRLLAERDGRVKQATIADALDWSDARTSQVVGELRERGDVETYRVGRENVVALPEKTDI